LANIGVCMELEASSMEIDRTLFAQHLENTLITKQRQIEATVTIHSEIYTSETVSLGVYNFGPVIIDSRSVVYCSYWTHHQGSEL